MLTLHTLIRLCRARDELRETRAFPLSIHDVAQTARMSPYHFIRRFEAVFGETPHQFRTWARLERAKHLLALSDYSVTDVCMEVGFTSLGSFSNLFAQRVGVAPSLYRRQIRSLIQVPGNLAQELFPGCLTLMSRLPPLRTFREVPESP
jgi:AraC-like DNA-binding protein